MIVKYTAEEFENAKPMDLLPLECEYCGKIFYRFKRFIASSLKRKRDDFKYCSRTCVGSSQKKSHIVKCEQCGKEIKVGDSVYRNSKTKHFFCNNSCSASYNNAKRGPVSKETKKKTSESLTKYYEERYGNGDRVKSKKYKTVKIEVSKKENSKYRERICRVCGKTYTMKDSGSTRTLCSRECLKEYRTNRKEYLSEDAIEKLKQAGRKSAEVQGNNRRSKNEKYFCELCEKHFKNVKHNEPIFNGWDADVIIEDIKYAILWNGKWHYEQIKEDHSVKQVQNRDKIKIQEIKKCGYTPYVIKDMGKYKPSFVEEQFESFLSDIDRGVEK